jgi:NCAIR mutase (PurE)-related protein
MSGWIDWHAWLVLILVGFLPNEVWRMLGVVLARGIDEKSEILGWVRAVATAVLAGVVAQLIFFPAGALAAVPLTVRAGAAFAGFVAFLAMRRSVFAGVAVGEAVLLAGALLLLP